MAKDRLVDLNVKRHVRQLSTTALAFILNIHSKDIKAMSPLVDRAMAPSLL